MKSKISVLGCGPTGIQAVVYLLERWHGEVLLYDADVDYAKGMALDCMQASAVRNWRASVRAVESGEELCEGSLLIIAENVDGSLDERWIAIARDCVCGIYAGAFEGAIEAAVQGGVSANSILGVQGIVDAKVLADEVSRVLNVSKEDVKAMVFGGVGRKMRSHPDFVRVSGIPVSQIDEGAYEGALAAAQAKDAYADEPWAPSYTLAAAAVELALIMESGLGAILPITGRSGTVPALVADYGVQKVYDNLV